MRIINLRLFNYHSFLIFLTQIIVILCIMSPLIAAEEQEKLPDCHTIPYFISQSLSQSKLEVIKNNDLNISCLLRPGSAIEILLGSPEIRFLSPLRNQVSLAGQSIQNMNNLIEKKQKLSLIERLKEFLQRLVSYPWCDPIAIERFFFQRQFIISFKMDTSSMEGVSTSHLFSMAVLDKIRATSFSPTIDGINNKNSPLICNFSDILDVYRNNNKVSSSMARMVGNFGVSSILNFFFTGNGNNQGSKILTSGIQEIGDVFISEELGPHRGSSLWLPSWMAAWFGSKPTATSETLLRETGKNNNYTEFIFEAEMPIVKPICLRLATVREVSLAIHLEEIIVFDTFWLKIILLLCLVWFLQPWIEDIPALQILLAGMGSVIVLTGFIMLFFLRKLQSMTLGKLGLFAVLAMGGISALTESFLSAMAALLYTYIRYDDGAELLFYIILILSIVGISCGLFAKFLWASYLSTLTRWTLRWVQLCILACAGLQNREATLVFIILSIVLHPPRVLKVILWCSRSESLENRENDPQEKFPSAARRAVAYAPPLCVEGRLTDHIRSNNFIGRAMSSEEKLEMYEVVGQEYTRLALAHLAEKIKSDPQKYTSRVRDPNEVSNWARKFK